MIPEEDHNQRTSMLETAVGDEYDVWVGGEHINLCDMDDVSVQRTQSGTFVSVTDSYGRSIWFSFAPADALLAHLTTYAPHLLNDTPNESPEDDTP